MVGTAMNRVEELWSCHRPQITFGSNFGCISTVAPLRKLAARPLMMPWTWWSGSTWIRWSEGLYSQALTRQLAWKVMFSCVVTQPLGFDVVPEV